MNIGQTTPSAIANPSSSRFDDLQFYKSRLPARHQPAEVKEVGLMKHRVFQCAALGAFIFVGGSVAQQQPPPDLNQLKTKLQQLQQMMQDLQKQIAAVESAQSPPGAPLAAPT